MTLHTRRKIVARGKPHGDQVSIMAHLPADYFAALQNIALQKGLPLTQILRNAVWAYVLPFKGKAE